MTRPTLYLTQEEVEAQGGIEAINARGFDVVDADEFVSSVLMPESVVFLVKNYMTAAIVGVFRSRAIAETAIESVRENSYEKFGIIPILVDDANPGGWVADSDTTDLL